MSPNHNDPIFATADAAETAFYQAFASCDVRAMESVWADAGVICIHPGATALVGREAVMRSWTNILSQAEPPDIYIEVLSRTERDGLAVHLVEEHIKSTTNPDDVAAVVLSTNIYCLEEDSWRLLEHHASVPNPRQITH